ncbi:MAG: SEL1-like repeat protein [Alistipes sp.]|nr:SEL1-like repeat protein [Alistipes sp.]
MEKIDQSYRLSPSSQKQQQLIEEIIKDFPDSKEMLEYEDYLKEPTVGNASEFITRALEDNAYEVMQTKTYADYIATRPRAERFGSHGLFTDDGIPVKLDKVSEELNNYNGNVWTVIISLRREDAERLGYNQGERWREMLRTQAAIIAKNFKIPAEDLHWYAAFHNESHHPHVHLMVYSDESQTPYLARQGIMNLRSSFAKEIFRDDLQEIYSVQTEHRDELRQHGSQLIAEIVEQINSGVYDNPKVEEMLRELADRLYRTGGKKQYGYLKSDVKALVNRIVVELSADERIAALYDLWCEQREKVLGIYTQDLPERIPLVDNPEFKSVKNAVISEAMNILANITPVDEDEEDIVLDTPEPAPEEMERAEQERESAAHMSERERISAMWRYYRQAKELLDRESEDYDPDTAVDLLIDSAKLGCDVAKYRLGKMFLRGEDVAKNTDYALRWLEDAVADGNQYAEYLLGKTLLRGEDAEQNLPRAEDLLKRSSDKGNRYAKYALGKAYLEGLLLLQDIPEAIRLLTESADSGFAPAQYLLGKLMSQGEVIPKDLERAIDYLERAAGQGNPYAAYLAGKLLLTEEDIKDILRAIKNFEIAAENGNDYAEYQLGKLYLYGREIDRDYDKAMEYLQSAAEKGNPYAKQLLHSIKNNKNWSATMGSIRLLHHLARMLQNRLEDERKDKMGGIDRKLKRKIDEKKQAHGLKQ